MMGYRMLIIGLTGGIGSGKSTVSQTLAELGAVILDADKIGHECYRPGTEGWKEVVATFGRGILGEKGEIDRGRLAEIVFKDGKSLARLNEIVHPKIFRKLKERLKEMKGQGVGVVVLEAAILVEADWLPLVDQVWVTVAPEATVRERLRRYKGLSEEQFQRRLRSQMPVEEKVKYADVIIDTDCSLDEVKAKVKGLWDKLQREQRKNEDPL